MSMSAITSKSPSYFVLSGPPGSGKTSLLKALGSRVQTVAEPARRVLAEQRRIGGTATGDQDPAAFVAQMLALAVRDYGAASGISVFDRGLPDLLGFTAFISSMTATFARPSPRTATNQQSSFYQDGKRFMRMTKSARSILTALSRSGTLFVRAMSNPAMTWSMCQLGLLRRARHLFWTR